MLLNSIIDQYQTQIVHKIQVFIAFVLAIGLIAPVQIYAQSQEKPASCIGTKLCVTGKVRAIIDGDTLVVDKHIVRLSLVNTPEKNQKGFTEAKAFTAKVCPKSSLATFDQDDKQPVDQYKRNVGKITCSGKNLNEELLNKGHAVILTQYCPKSEFATEPWATKFGCEQKQVKSVKVDEKSSLTQLSDKWEIISDFGYDVKKVVPTTVSGFNGVHNIGVLGSLAPNDPDVSRQWEYLVSSIRYMNSKQIGDWISLMQERAKKENLDSASMNYFNEQMKKAQKQQELKSDREPIKSKPYLQSYSISQYKQKLAEYKNELGSMSISERHSYVRDKIIQYLGLVDSAIDNYVVGEGNALAWQQAEDLFGQADDLKYEIDGKFIAEKDRLNNLIR